MPDLFSTKASRPGQANGEFLAHLAEVIHRRQTLEWLRGKWSTEVNAEMARQNLKHWGLV